MKLQVATTVLGAAAGLCALTWLPSQASAGSLQIQATADGIDFGPTLNLGLAVFLEHPAINKNISICNNHSIHYSRLAGSKWSDNGHNSG
jgi:hypothetical protein